MTIYCTQQQIKYISVAYSVIVLKYEQIIRIGCSYEIDRTISREI